MTATQWQWDYEYLPRWRRLAERSWKVARRPLAGLALGAAAFLSGMRLAGAPSPIHLTELTGRLRTTEAALEARRGELDLARMEVRRLNVILEQSARYRIPADLAASIYDAALSEGIAPNLAFELVRVESQFYPRAVSPVGAVGLTQVMPETAFLLDPRLKYEDLFEPETNLRLGFRFLRAMLEKYDGDMRLALLAYNRGPATVDRIRSAGGNPANGYARAVMGGSR